MVAISKYRMDKNLTIIKSEISLLMNEDFTTKIKFIRHSQADLFLKI